MFKAFARTLIVVLFVFGFCVTDDASFAQELPPQGQAAPGQPAPVQSGPVPETRMGMWRGRPVTYQVIDGRNIYEGDIILENVQPMPQASTGDGVHSNSVGLANSNFLWPKINGVAQIPYVIDSGSGDVANINSAISIYNATFDGIIQMVPRSSQANYIDINLSNGLNGSCEATEGDANAGEQFVGGASNCTVATILHEFGHVTGVWHEQSRTDASTYVTFNEGNVIKGSIGNFLPAQDNDQQNLTFYDYASVMEYPAFSFDRNGAPPLDSIPPGMPLSNPVGYSAADVEGIMRLYGVAPTEVTVTSNPLGLQVIVDGSTVTTPMTFNWSLNSMHTLAVATGVQTVNGIIVGSSNPQQPTTFYYEYGRWNDGGAQSHSITVTPGNGDAGFPVSAPQVATYTANFIQLVPYTPSVFPAGSGTVTLTGTPAPQSITVNGVPGTYVVARQQATLTATANSGFSFYEFNNGPYWLAGGLGSNPKTFYVPESGLTVNTGVEFSNTPVYTVDVTPNYFSSNLGVLVDGGFWPVPKNFSSMYDGSGWNSGTMHTLEFSTPQQPFSVNTQFVFSSWNIGGTANTPNTIILPAASTSYIATILPEYVPATNFGGFGPCGGSATVTPASTISGGFYASGTQLTYTETPSPNTGGSPWIFAGWTFDLTGTTNPDTLSPTNESLVYANFNTTSAPLTITSLSPASVASGSSDLTLTINGTGFAPNGTGNPIEVVGFNFFQGPTFPVTFVSSTEIQVTVPAADIATPGTFLLYVENFPSAPWNGCAVFADQPFFVHQGTPSGATTVTAMPTTLSFPSTVADQASAGQTITVKNTGSTATTIGITASTNFDQTNNCPVAPATLAGGTTCTITATFAPTTAGRLTGNIAVTDSASNSPQTVTLSGTATAAPTTVTATPTNLAFGSQAVGTTSPSQTTMVQNTGSASTSIAIAASANYSQINNCGTLLQVGTSCTITVSFTPTANGSLPGTISITDSAANSPQSVTLSGTGISSSTTVTTTPSTEAFASTAVGNTSASKVVTVKNTGTANTAIAITTSGDFGQTNTCGSTLNAGATCTITATFSPTATGAITGAITISDSAANSPQIVSLTGTGLAPVTFSPATLAFGSVAVGSTSAAKIVTMTNNQSIALSFTFSASANYSAVAGTTTPCTGNLAAKGKCTISVTFTPTSKAAIDGVLTITDTAPFHPQEVKLTGTGTGGTTSPLKFTPTSLTFTSQAIGTTSGAKIITVKNVSAGSLNVSSVVASGNFTATSGTTPCAGALAANASCEISVTFSPTIIGSNPGAITVNDNASVTPQIVNLTGTAIAPVTFSPTSLTFASQAVGTTSSAQTVTVKNNTSGSLTLGIVASGDFGIAAGGTCSSPVGANSTCTLNVTFTPSKTGSIKGVVTVSDTAAGSPQILKLTGTGS